MEAVGLAVGVVSLTSLFKTTLEIWEFVDAGRSHAQNFSLLRTKLDTQRVLFLIWAERMGFGTPAGHHAALDDPRISPAIEKIFKHIQLLFSDTDQLVKQYGFMIREKRSLLSTAQELRQDDSRGAIFQSKYYGFWSATIDSQEGQKRRFRLFRLTTKSASTPEGRTSIWKVTRWVIKDEKKFDVLIKHVADLVGDLERLTNHVPTAKSAEQLAMETVRSISEADQPALAQIEEASGDSETVISSAASIYLRSLDAKTISSSVTDGTYLTAQTTPRNPRIIVPDEIENFAERKLTIESSFHEIELENIQTSESCLSSLIPNGPGSKVRIFKELQNQTVNGWCSMCPIDDSNLFKLMAVIRGPPGTPYEGGIFYLKIDLPHDYPFTPPRIWFLTRILHPNIDRAGAICLDILRDQWSAQLWLEKALLSIVALLDKPNWDEPVADDFVGGLARRSQAAFEANAEMWTARYATRELVFHGDRSDGHYNVTYKGPHLPVPPGDVPAPGREAH